MARNNYAILLVTATKIETQFTSLFCCGDEVSSRGSEPPNDSAATTSTTEPARSEHGDEVTAVHDDGYTVIDETNDTLLNIATTVILKGSA